MLNGTQGVNEMVAGLVGQGLTILDTLKRSPAVSGNGAAPAAVARAQAPAAAGTAERSADAP